MKKTIGKNRQTHQAGRQGGVAPVVLAAVVITLAALGLLFGPDAIHAIRGRATQSDLQELYRGKKTSLMDWLLPTANAEEVQPEATAQPLAVHEDFADLYEANGHLVAWLTAGEKIDYPVVQYDNTFYLDHDFFGREDTAGTLFVNASNRLDPRDSILLIHGHNMRVGTMFGDLDYFREYKYARKYPIVTFRMINDPEDVYYVPIACFDASMDPDEEGYFDITRVRFEFDVPAETPEDKPKSTALEQYIAGLREQSHWRSPAAADSTDEYIMLVTCSYLQDDGRTVLVCRKLRDNETPESIDEKFNP